MRSLLIASLLLCLLAPVARASHSAEVGLADDRQIFSNPSVATSWAAAGVDMVRIHARWSSIAPSPKAKVPPSGFHFSDPSDPGYDFSALDRAVAAVRDAGMRVTLAVTGPGPVWASQDPSRGDGRYKPDPAHFRAFATAVAKRYAADVDRYLIWNEPNQPLWLQPQKYQGKPYSPHVYRALVNAAVPAIHAADPGSTVVMGTLAPSGSDSRSSGSPVRPLAFLRALACESSTYHAVHSGPCRHFKAPAADGFSLHPHSIKASPDAHARSRDDAPLADLGRFEAALDKLTAKHRLRVLGGPKHFPIYLTEFGYQTNPPDRYLGVSASTQARWLIRGARRAYDDPRVRNLTWYVWRDEPLGSGGSGWQSGLFSSSGRAKPSLQAFKAPFSATTRSVWGQIRPGAGHRVALQGRTKSGSYKAITSFDTDSRGSFSRSFKAPKWVRYLRVRVIDATASAGLDSRGVRIR